MNKIEKNRNLEELLRAIAASGTGIRVLVKKGDQSHEPTSHEVESKKPVGKADKPTTESKDSTKPGKKPLINIHIKNLHIHMDERMTTNYGPGALASASDDCECGENSCECDCCSCAHNDDDDDGIDFDEMLLYIRRHTGLCERNILMVLAAQMEYLDAVIDEEDEA